MSKTIKLTAGGQKYVSECLRYECKICGETLLLHPTRWPLHVEECAKKISTEHLTLVFKSEKENFIKDLLARQLMLRHNGEKN